MKWRLGPPRGQAGRTAGLVSSAVVHCAALAFFLVGVDPPEPAPPVYAVELVAAPLPRPEARRAPEVVERPPEEPAPIEPEPDAELEEPEPEPAPIPTPEETEPVPEAAEKPVTPLPGEKPSTGSDIANVKTPGLEFPYPNYLRNIVAQVLRRWNRPTSPSELRAEVSFLIMRDGSVRDIRFVKPSGNFSFDLAAQGAIEAAANVRAFGPLPDGYQADILPVSFFFSPRTPE